MTRLCNNTRFLAGIFFLAVFSLCCAAVAFAGTYYLNSRCSLPPSISSGTKPNVMVILDYSGSMQFPAYVGYTSFNYVVKRDTGTYQYVNLAMPMGEYRPEVTYYGTFNPNKYYVYDGSAPSKEYFYEGGATVAVTSSADNGDGTIVFYTASAHGLLPGDVAVITGLDKHTALNNGAFKCLSGTGGTTLRITAPWNPPGASDTTGQVSMRTTAAITASTGGQSAGSPITFTTAEPHLLSNGDVVVLTALNSNKTLNGHAFVVSGAAGDEFTITPGDSDDPAVQVYRWNSASDTSGFFERRSMGNFATAISGNVLNYYATCRMDAAQKALIGGRADCPGDGNCYIKGQGARRVQPESTSLLAEFFVDLGKSLDITATTMPVYNDSNLWTGSYWNKGDYWDKTTFITVRDYQHSSTVSNGDIASGAYPGWYYERWILNLSEAGFVSLGLQPTWDEPVCALRVFVRNADGTIGSEITPNSEWDTNYDPVNDWNKRPNIGPKAYYQAMWEKESLPAGQYYVLAYGGNTSSRRGNYFLYANRPLTKTTDADHNGVSYASRLGNRANKKRMQVRLRVPTAERQGTLQKNFKNVRIGLMTYHSSIYGDCDGDCGQIVVGCENSDVNKLVKAVQADQPYVAGYDESTYEQRYPIGGTPTSGTLYEALRYYKQTGKIGSGDANMVPSSANSGFIGRGGAHDPYYDYVTYGEGSGEYVFRPCRKSFALVVTDGLPDQTGYRRYDQPCGNKCGTTNDADPARAAREFHISTLRSDVDGTDWDKVPNAELFAIFAFGGDGGYERRGQSCLRSMVMFGSFKEGGNPTGCTSVTGWPYPFGSWNFDSKFLKWAGLDDQDPDGYKLDNRPQNMCPVNSPTTYKECCKEWDRIWDQFGLGGEPDQGTPDNFFEASSGAKLERGLSTAFQTMAGALGGAGGAIATVYRDRQAAEGEEQQTVDYLGDLVLRGVYDANDTTPGLLERSYLWRGHLEIFWPFRAGEPETGSITASASAAGGSSITFTCAEAPNLLVGDDVTFTGLDQHDSLNGQTLEVTAVYQDTFTVSAAWDPPGASDSTGQFNWVSAKYDFDLPEAYDSDTQQVKLCNDIILDIPTYGRIRHCWDAAKVLSNRVNTKGDVRTIYVPKYKWDSAINRPVLDLDVNGKIRMTTLGNTSDTECSTDCWNFLLLNTADNGVAAMDKYGKLIEWLEGYDNSNTTQFFRDRRDSQGKSWPLGDIVFSTPVVVGNPAPDAVSPNDPDRASYNTFYSDELAATKDQVIYVGANDGMIHAFRLGRYCAEKGIYVHTKDEWDKSPACTTPTTAEKDFGRELWAFMPSAAMNQVRCLGDLVYGTESGCKHRAMVDLSPKAHQVLINGEWRTVIVGGMRGGGDEYFALDVTDPNNPKLLWEYSVLKDLLTYDGSEYHKLDAATEHYDDLKLLPVTWSRPALGRLNLGDISLPTEDPQGGQPMTASPALNGNRHVIFVGGGFRIFDRTLEFLDGSDPEGVLPTVLQRPFLLALDVATGKNLFRYVWPNIQQYVQENYPDVYFRYLTRNDDMYGIPYSVSDPLLLDYLQKQTDGTIISDTDGFVDHLFIGDVNGLLYAFKFNLLGVNGPQGVRVDLRLTKGVEESAADAPYRSMYRSIGQPIVVQPQAKKETTSPGYMRVIFGTGKYDDVLVGSDDKSDPPRMTLYNMRDPIGGTTFDTDGNPTYNAPQLAATGAVGQQIGDSGFSLYVRNMCGTITDSAGTRERLYNSGSTWLKLDQTHNPVLDALGKPEADCGEDNCANSCWKCVYDFTLPIATHKVCTKTQAEGEPPVYTCTDEPGGVPPDSCDTASKCAVKAGERVNTDSLIYWDWVFVTSYVPPATPCDYKGHGYLYAFSWMCDNVSNPFTDHNPPYEMIGPFAYRMELGEGMPSNPVLDSQGRFVFIQMSDRRIVKIGIVGGGDVSGGGGDEPPPGADELRIKVMGWSEREK